MKSEIWCIVVKQLCDKKNDILSAAMIDGISLDLEMIMDKQFLQSL